MRKESAAQTRKRVLQFMDFLEPDEIAERLEISRDRVLSIIGTRATHRVACVVIDRKSGRVTHHASFPAAYRFVCIKGLTDWSWHTLEAFLQWQRVNAQ